MKKLLCVILILSFISIYNTSAQVGTCNLKASIAKKYKELNKGDRVTLTEVSISEIYDSILYASSNKVTVKLKNDQGREFIVPIDVIDTKKIDSIGLQVKDIWDIAILTKVYPMLLKKGTQVELRGDIEYDALSYVSKIKSSNLELDDPYLKDYINKLIMKIAPSSTLDGRPYSINSLIVKNPEINAATLPNGTIIINTGLLAALHSEDELVSILTHEIAHYMLDHSIQNINTAETRRKRAEFWSTIATTVAAVGDISIATKTGYYYTPTLTYSTAILSEAISKEVCMRLGIEYNQAQELSADDYAIKVLNALGYDTNALATALSRIRDYLTIERSNAMYLASSTHPALVARISRSGMVKNMEQNDYEKRVYCAINDCALYAFRKNRYKQALAFTQQNIDNNVALADDYIINAYSTLYTQNNEESNNKVLAYVKKAKELDSTNFNISRLEILSLLRLNKNSEAKTKLDEYRKLLNEYSNSLKDVASENMKSMLYEFILDETNWIKRMNIIL